MIRPDQIPDEVVEAGARSFCYHYTGKSGDERQRGVIGDGSDDFPFWKSFEQMALAAIAAGLNAWPGIQGAWYEGDTPTAYIIPFPQKGEA
jgi:hypothetical protein